MIFVKILLHKKMGIYVFFNFINFFIVSFSAPWIHIRTESFFYPDWKLLISSSILLTLADFFLWLECKCNILCFCFLIRIKKLYMFVLIPIKNLNIRFFYLFLIKIKNKIKKHIMELFKLEYLYKIRSIILLSYLVNKSLTY